MWLRPAGLRLRRLLLMRTEVSLIESPDEMRQQSQRNCAWLVLNSDFDLIATDIASVIRVGIGCNGCRTMTYASASIGLVYPDNGLRVGGGMGSMGIMEG